MGDEQLERISASLDRLRESTGSDAATSRALGVTTKSIYRWRAGGTAVKPTVERLMWLLAEHPELIAELTAKFPDE